MTSSTLQWSKSFHSSDISSSSQCIYNPVARVLSTSIEKDRVDAMHARRSRYSTKTRKGSGASSLYRKKVEHFYLRLFTVYSLFRLLASSISAITLVLVRDTLRPPFCFRARQQELSGLFGTRCANRIVTRIDYLSNKGKCDSIGKKQREYCS